MPIDTAVRAEDVDERAIRWVCQGTRMNLTGRDAIEAVLRLQAAGLPVDDIAIRLYLTRREVKTIIRSELRRRAQQRATA